MFRKIRKINTGDNKFEFEINNTILRGYIDNVNDNKEQIEICNTEYPNANYNIYSIIKGFEIGRSKREILIHFDTKVGFSEPDEIPIDNLIYPFERLTINLDNDIVEITFLTNFEDIYSSRQYLDALENLMDLEIFGKEDIIINVDYDSDILNIIITGFHKSLRTLKQAFNRAVSIIQKINEEVQVEL